MKTVNQIVYIFNKARSNVLNLRTQFKWYRNPINFCYAYRVKKNLAENLEKTANLSLTLRIMVDMLEEVRDKGLDSKENIDIAFLGWSEDISALEKALDDVFSGMSQISQPDVTVINSALAKMDTTHKFLMAMGQDFCLRIVLLTEVDAEEFTKDALSKACGFIKGAKE